MPDDDRCQVVADPPVVGLLVAGRCVQHFPERVGVDSIWVPEFWAYDDVAPHWDRLVLRAHIAENDGRTLYQEGSVAAMLDPKDLIAQYSENAGLADGTLMFCGTLAARGGVRTSSDFTCELEDPVLGRNIGCRYRVRTLPVL